MSMGTNGPTQGERAIRDALGKTQARHARRQAAVDRLRDRRLQIVQAIDHRIEQIVNGADAPDGTPTVPVLTRSERQELEDLVSDLRHAAHRNARAEAAGATWPTQKGRQDEEARAAQLIRDWADARTAPQRDAPEASI